VIRSDCFVQVVQQVVDGISITIIKQHYFNSIRGCIMEVIIHPEVIIGEQPCMDSNNFNKLNFIQCQQPLHIVRTKSHTETAAPVQ